MDIKFEKTGEGRAVMTVSLVKEDYAQTVDNKLKEIGKTHTIPGFRKGHIALPELRKRFGREVKSDAINRVVIDAAFDYIEKNNIKVIGQPLPATSTEIDLKQDDYTFNYDVALWPEIDLKLDKEVKTPFYLIEVSDEMVAEQDNAMRERFGAQVAGEKVDEKALVKGSIMELNADGSVKAEDDAIQVTSGIVAPFMFKDKEEAAKFIDKAVNDKVVFNPSKACEGSVAELASMLNIDKEKAAEVNADFEFSIAEIVVVKPAELGQEYYDEVFGKDKVHTEEEYFDNIKKMIQAQLIPNSLNLSNRDLHNYLMTTYGDSIVVDKELLMRWMNLNSKETITDEEYEKSLPGIKWELISTTVSEKLEVKVEEEDLRAQANQIARQQLQQYGMFNMDDETVADMGKRILADRKFRQQIFSQVEEAKTFNALRNAFTVEEKTVSLDEFKNLAAAE